MASLDLTEFYKEQKLLDEDIFTRHDVSYGSTQTRRLLALIVEIGELINATRCHKFWSVKDPESKERILDEYADGMHFFLSNGLSIGVTSTSVEYEESDADINEQFYDLYHAILVFFDKRDEETYLLALSKFFSLVYPLGYTVEDLLDAYHKKMAVNHQRQETHY
ncbi:MAG: dUTP diphosphatase [Coprobacillus sp.]|nr:dUTP diphosphatase [Coprobacillus sp.]